MKRLRIVPDVQNKKRRFRWYHVLICSVLIAALFISMSVGLGYARFIAETDSLEAEYTVKADIFKSPGYVFAKRVPGEDTVLVSEDGNLKVTVPATATGPEIDNAEYLLLKFDRTTADMNRYDYENKQNRMTYMLSLHSISYYSNQDNPPILVDENNSIEVELKVGHDATDFASIAPSQASIPNEYDEENGVLRFVGLNRIGARSGQYQIATNTFSASFDRSTVPADTSWFDDSYGTFIINTAAELAGVAQLVNEGVTDFAGKTIQLGSDISLYNQDNSKYTWDPIGNDVTPFKGSFNGDGHTISGLNLRVYYDTDADENRTCGLFGEVAGDGTNTIENLTLKNVSYAADMGVYEDSDEGQAFGSLAGYTSGVNISNVHVDGLNVYGTAKYIGGIVGRGDSNGTLSDCSVERAVFDTDGADYVGGIVGLQFGNGEDKLLNCYVSAEINGSYQGAGGIVGLALGDHGAMGVENSYYIGSFAPTSDDAYCGGIVGLASSAVDKDYTINNCYADCTADLIGYSCFGYKVYEGQQTIEDALAERGNRIVVANSNWSGDNDSFTWLSYAYDAGYDEYQGTGEKSDECWFNAGMTYEQYLDALRAHGAAPEVPTEPETEAPTEPPTEPETEAPTVPEQYATEQYETPIH